MKLQPCKCGTTQGNGLNLCMYKSLLDGEIRWEVYCEQCGTTLSHMESKEDAVKFWNESFSKKRGN